MSLAIGAEATFVARSVDVFQAHLKDTLKAAAAHKGSAFIEILQNCNIFNDGAWFSLTEREARSEQVLQLEHGKPHDLRQKSRQRHPSQGRMATSKSCSSGNGITETDLLVHDMHHPRPSLRLHPCPYGVCARDSRRRSEFSVRGPMSRAMKM